MNEVDKIMRDMKRQGITINVTPASGASDDVANRPAGVIADAARRHGIYYGDEA